MVWGSVPGRNRQNHGSTAFRHGDGRALTAIDLAHKSSAQVPLVHPSQKSDAGPGGYC